MKIAKKIMAPVLTVAACVLTWGLTATSASAGIIISGQETGSDVVFTMSGTYDVTGLDFFQSEVVSTAVGGDRGVINLGPNSSNSYDFYDGFTVFPNAFGTGSTVLADFQSGDFLALTRSGNLRVIGVASGTTTGSVTGSISFSNTTFSALGLTEGSYLWSWPEDSVRLNIGAAVPVPATLGLFGLGLVGLGWSRRKKA
jgi:hypothetical protein